MDLPTFFNCFPNNISPPPPRSPRTNDHGLITIPDCRVNSFWFFPAQFSKKRESVKRPSRLSIFGKPRSRRPKFSDRTFRRTRRGERNAPSEVPCVSCRTARDSSARCHSARRADLVVAAAAHAPSTGTARSRNLPTGVPASVASRPLNDRRHGVPRRARGRGRERRGSLRHRRGASRAPAQTRGRQGHHVLAPAQQGSRGESRGEARRGRPRDRAGRARGSHADARARACGGVGGNGNAR